MKQITALLMSALFGYVGMSISSSILPLYAQSLGASDSQITLLLFAFFFASALMSPFLGALSDDLEMRKAFMLLGLSAYTIALALSVIATDIFLLILARFIGGFGIAAYGPASLAFVSYDSTRQVHGRNISTLYTSRSASWMCGAFFGGIVADLTSYNMSLLMGTITSFIAFFIALFLIRDYHPNKQKQLTTQSIRKAFHHAKRRYALLFSSRSEGFTNQPGVRLLLTAYLIRNLTILGALSLLPIYVASISDPLIVASIVGIMFAINTGSQSISMPLVGRLTDKIGRKPMIIIGMAGAVLVPFGYSIADQVIIFMITQVLLGLTYATLEVGVVALSTDITMVKERGEAMGVVNTARAVGGFIGPVIVGILVLFLSHVWMLRTLTIITFGGFILALYSLNRMKNLVYAS